MSHHVRSKGIPCSLYIDDRHNGQLACPSTISPLSGYDLALAAIFYVCYLVVSLGYFIGLDKSILEPSQQVPYLGFTSDSRKQAFTLLPHKKEKFLLFVRDILNQKAVELVTLQKLAGKCISMALAVPGARLFTNEINLAISKAARTSRPLPLSPSLRAEIEHWLFLESWDGYLPWLSEFHSHIHLCTDSSSFAWGGVLSPGTLSVSSADYWPNSIVPQDIATKEALALANVLQSFASQISGSWVDVFTDSQALIQSWEKQGSRSKPLFDALKLIFSQTLSANIFLNLHYIPSSFNPADMPSRRLTPADSALSLPYWQQVQTLFGGPQGHSVDLMALPSNVRPHLDGAPLPFFSPFPVAGATAVNLFAQDPAHHPSSLFRNPYVFPPIILVGQLLRFLIHFPLPCTLVIPDVFPRKYWWPLLCSHARSSHKLARKGDPGVLLCPSSRGYQPLPALSWDLWVFRL